MPTVGSLGLGNSFLNPPLFEGHPGGGRDYNPFSPSPLTPSSDGAGGRGVLGVVGVAQRALGARSVGLLLQPQLRAARAGWEGAQASV